MPKAKKFIGYKKLVRDNVENIINSSGDVAITRKLKDEEYIQMLNKKLLEETNEYLKSENVEELADIVEVILAILKFKEIPKTDFETIRRKKANEKGSFNKRICLEYVLEFIKDEHGN